MRRTLRLRICDLVSSFNGYSNAAKEMAPILDWGVPDGDARDS